MVNRKDPDFSFLNDKSKKKFDLNSFLSRGSAPKEVSSVKSALADTPPITISDDFKADNLSEFFQKFREEGRQQNPPAYERGNIAKTMKKTGVANSRSKVDRLDPSQFGKRTRVNMFRPIEFIELFEITDLRRVSDGWNKEGEGVGKQGMKFNQLAYALTADALGLQAPKDRSGLFDKAVEDGHIDKSDIEEINKFLAKRNIKAISGRKIQEQEVISPATSDIAQGRRKEKLADRIAQKDSSKGDFER